MKFLHDRKLKESSVKKKKKDYLKRRKDTLLYKKRMKRKGFVIENTWELFFGKEVNLKDIGKRETITKTTE
tara:strand:+ start:327 stop:539 length:213 start_codon:yes stop_codon:yes gene_type:complete